MDTFASFDDLDLAYLDEGKGAPVVLLHGFAADHFSNWVATGVVDALVGAGRRVLAPDARGHGASAKPHDPSAYANDAMLRDVQSLMDHAALDHVDVVGYSMGAIVAGRPRTAGAKGSLTRPRWRRRRVGRGNSDRSTPCPSPRHLRPRTPRTSSIRSRPPFDDSPTAPGPTVSPWRPIHDRARVKRPTSPRSQCRRWCSSVTPISWPDPARHWPSESRAPPFEHCGATI
jgi:pimeloyl-ACP methyl ester carboxylesterase